MSLFGKKKRRESTSALEREVPSWISAPLIVASLAAALWLELRRPLRRRVESKLRRDSRNLAMSVLSAAAIRLTEKPITDRLARWVHRRRWGIVKRMNLPPGLEVGLAVILLDYMLYVWHVLTHELPFLWRFHRVHHADLDLDASTALRFHFVEMILSVPWRAGQVLLVGASPLSISTWQTLTLVAIVFHHSNLELPVRAERWLCRLVMTPRMHGIHHSMVKAERNSNWATILAFPDYLHGTYRLNVPQKDVTIGVPEYRRPQELTLKKILAMPFGSPPPLEETLLDVRAPEQRSPSPAPAGELMA